MIQAVDWEQRIKAGVGPLARSENLVRIQCLLPEVENGEAVRRWRLATPMIQFYFYGDIQKKMHIFACILPDDESNQIWGQHSKLFTG